MEQQHHCRYQVSYSHEESSTSTYGGEIIFGVSVHCCGCEKEIRKSIRGFNGVESVEFDSEKNIVKVKVKGKDADPIKVAERIKKKTGKTVQLISPKLLPPKQLVKKKEAPPMSPMVEVSLEMYLHCDGCVIDVRRRVLKFPGVQTVQLDKEKNLVMVKGTVEVKKLVEYLTETTGKHVEIVKQNAKKNEGKQVEIVKQNATKNKEGKDHQGSYYHDHTTTKNKECEDHQSSCYNHTTHDHVYYPNGNFNYQNPNACDELFSDENVNACCVM